MQSVGVRGAKLFVKNVLRLVFRVMSGGFERSGVHRESIRPLDHGRVDGSDGVQRHELHEGQHGQPERAEVPGHRARAGIEVVWASAHDFAFNEVAFNAFLSSFTILVPAEWE